MASLLGGEVTGYRVFRVFLLYAIFGCKFAVKLCMKGDVLKFSLTNLIETSAYLVVVDRNITITTTNQK